MLDLDHIEKYKENNRIEAKKAAGGLPKSLWETYSAFANTLGGIILLGVEELPGHVLHPVELPDPEGLVREFWERVNDPKQVSINLLSDKNVRIEEAEGKRIVVIEVPRAQRIYKPVYIGGDPVNGSYRRNGEGDYHCTPEELRAMYRDAGIQTQDMKLLEELSPDALCTESIRSYRQRMGLVRPGHVWESLGDREFLIKLGALGMTASGSLHPTAAGLLMFGYEYDILREYPLYFLDYREITDSESRWTDRIVSSSGDWSGNVYDFYFRVYNRLRQELSRRFQLEGGLDAEDSPVMAALREALANCLINADYYGSRGVVVVRTPEKISMANPGNFRIDLAEARSGGLSDPRNAALMRMFDLINIGERAGSGIPSIYTAWTEQGCAEPRIFQCIEPDRTVLELPLVSVEGCEKGMLRYELKPQPGAAASVREGGDIKFYMSPEEKRELIIAYLTDHVSAGSAELSELLGLKASRTRDYLSKMVEDGILVCSGANKNRRYRLRS
jgi:predicted HTH transcriptional regulator